MIRLEGIVKFIASWKQCPNSRSKKSETTS